jgi:glycosyltransferase involved in cell wall biosynthesis
MTPEKLLFIHHNLLGGGAERVTLTLLRELAGRGYQITLFLFKKEGVYWSDLPEAIRVRAVLPAGSRTRHHPLRVCCALLKEARAHDLIVGGLEGWPTFLGFFAGLIAGRPVVGWLHTTLDRRRKQQWNILERLLAWFVYPRLNAMVCVSEGTLESLRRFTGKSGRRWHTIFNPVPARSLAVSALRLTSPSKMVLSVGRLDTQIKGYDLLIRAHVRLKKMGLPHNLVILGEGPDRASLENLARDEGVAESVFLPGFVGDVWAWYEKATVFALSSRREGLPTVLIEALAAGVPVVAADCESGPREILEDGKYGELVRSESCEALAEGLRRVLTDDSYRQRLAEAGPERAADFSPPHIADAWERMIAEVRA